MADRIDYNYEKIFINGLAYVHGSNLLYNDLFSTPYNGQYKTYTLESDPNSSKWAIIPYGYEFSRRFTYNASINAVKEEPRKFYIGTDESNLKEYTSVEGKAFEYDISAVDDDFVISFDMTNDFIEHFLMDPQMLILQKMDMVFLLMKIFPIQINSILSRNSMTLLTEQFMKISGM